MTDSELEELRAEAEALGVTVHGNAKAETVRKRIEEARAAADVETSIEPEQPEPEPEPEPDEPEPEPERPPAAHLRTVDDHLARRGARRRSWVNADGKRKTTTVGSGLDSWYESAEGWEPV